MLAAPGEDDHLIGVVECQANVGGCSAVYPHSKLVGLPTGSGEHEGIDIPGRLEGAVRTCVDLTVVDGSARGRLRRTVGSLSPRGKGKKQESEK